MTDPIIISHEQTDCCKYLLKTQNRTPISLVPRAHSKVSKGLRKFYKYNLRYFVSRSLLKEGLMHPQSVSNQVSLCNPRIKGRKL